MDIRAFLIPPQQQKPTALTLGFVLTDDALIKLHAERGTHAFHRIQPTMNLLSYLISVASGVANPFQAGANAELNKQIASPLWAAIFVYVSGLLGLLLVQLVLRHTFPATVLLFTVKPWAWLGGLASIVSTVVGLTLAQKLGSGVFTGLSVTASIVTSVALDHLGWIGFRQHTASQPASPDAPSW